METNPQKQIEQETSCFSCQYSTVLFNDLHCTRNGFAVKIYNAEICSQYKAVGE